MVGGESGGGGRGDGEGGEVDIDIDIEGCIIGRFCFFFFVL